MVDLRVLTILKMSYYDKEPPMEIKYVVGLL